MKERNFTEGPAGSLATAQDLALSNNPPTIEDSSPLTTRLLAHLADPANPKNRLPAEARAIEITEGVTMDSLTWNADPPIVSEEERSQLVALQAKYDFFESQEASFSPAKAVHHFHAQRDAIHDAAKAGNDVSDIKVDSKDQIEGEFLHRRVALRSAMVKLTHEEVVPICKRIFARLEKHLAESLRINEEQDRACATGFGLKYEPSLVWKALATVSQRYTVKARLPLGPHSTLSPRRMLAEIISL